MAEYQTPEFHPAFEEYCEAIFELNEDDVDVIQARIAERLEVSRPAVSEMIRKLEGEGLVEVDGRISLTVDGLRDSLDRVFVLETLIALTVDGLRLAESVVRRHRLAERFLTDVLKLSWAEAH